MATKPHPPAYAELHALLHTVRCIAQHEAQLCTLLHAIKTSGKLTAPIRKDLLTLLDQMPSADYTADLADLRTALE